MQHRRYQRQQLLSDKKDHKLIQKFVFIIVILIPAKMSENQISIFKRPALYFSQICNYRTYRRSFNYSKIFHNIYLGIL